MRIATSVVSNMMTNSMGNSYEKYMDVINKITSNKNFTSVSENPTDASKVLKLNDQLAQMNQYQSNIEAATNEMNYTYDTLGAVIDEITEIKGLIIEASNASTTPDSAKAINVEIKQRVASIVDKMNTQYLDNYIFSGTYIKEQAYVENPDGTYSYKGSNEEAGARKLTISEDTTLTYNFTGTEIFGKENDVNNFFSQMKELETLLEEDELQYNEIRKKLGVLDNANEKVIQMQGKVSAIVSKLNTTQEINNDTIIKLTENKVEIEEVDITKAATDLANAQQALQASYLIGTNVLGSVSLLDYL